jgi:hypothetical protein
MTVFASSNSNRAEMCRNSFETRRLFRCQCNYSRAFGPNAREPSPAPMSTARLTLSQPLIGTLAAMTFIGLAMGEDTYSARRRTRREASNRRARADAPNEASVVDATSRSE